jgi:hypothetical protein
MLQDAPATTDSEATYTGIPTPFSGVIINPAVIRYLSCDHITNS